MCVFISSLLFSPSSLSFPSYRIICIAFSITTHRHLFVLHGFKERFDSAPFSLVSSIFSSPPPSLHIPLGHRRASTALLRLHLGPHILIPHPDNIVVWIHLRLLYGSSTIYRILYSTHPRVDSPVIPASLKCSNSIHYPIIKS